MPGTISFGGIGSGIDTDAIVDGLVAANRGPISSLKSRAASTHAAVSVISEVSSLFATLQKSVEALEDVQDVNGYAATSSSAAVVATTVGGAAPGSFSIVVNDLAKEQRSYTTTFADASAALGQEGSLDIQVGSGPLYSVTIEAGDTLTDIANKINETDARVSASVFFDGTNYRLQTRGLDTGVANAVSLSENGVALGFSTVQAAQDASITVDGFTVTRGTNQFTGVIQGVTLAITEKTTDPVQVSVDTDPAALKGKLTDVVNAYNAVVEKIQSATGFGSKLATNPVLSGDSTLRSISNSLSGALRNIVGSGKYQTAASIGLESNNDGTLRLDDVDFEAALASDAEGVATVLAGSASTDGIMDFMRDVVKTFVAPSTGMLALKGETLESRAKTLDDQVEREETRLDRYADSLRRQFTQMDGVVSAYNAQLDYLVRLYGG